MESIGRRERKKEQTRRHISSVAARLFADRGFERVTVTDVARAADVAEQTVYNYFPTKEHLVLDEEEALRLRLVEAVRHRAPGTAPAAALRPVLLAFVDGVAALSPEEVQGGLGALTAVSPGLRRLSLAMTDRHAAAVGEVLIATTPHLDPDAARLHAVALVWVLQAVTDLSGQLVAEGLDAPRMATRLRDLVDRLFDELERWPAASSTPSTLSTSSEPPSFRPSSPG